MKTKLTTDVGRRMRKRREAMGFSQESFADHISLDRANYGSIERGERNVSITTLARIAKGLQVEIGELFPLLKEITIK